ncbi:MAG: ribbon-helix-helix domain-containing protein [Candidatus Bathyarchaeota archaeon]|nr:ribbon-helix-helix domain-containing protein [Candidatus Bathyarchaeota archaeon]
MLYSQSQCNWGKSTQTLFHVSIKPYFRLRKSYLKNHQDNKEKMVRPWVEVSLYQYQRLRKLKEETNRPLSEIIRKAVSKFVKKKDFPVSTTSLYLPKRSRDRYKSVSAYFVRSDWNLLEEISRNTGRSKTELIRQAVNEFLGNQV